MNTTESSRAAIQNPPEGYVYAPKQRAHPLREARAGIEVRIKDRRPPWIVVERSWTYISIIDWPGQMWRVRILDAVTENERGHKLVSDAHYTQAVAVAVLNEEPIAQIFGPHGAAVSRVLDHASQLDISQVEALAISQHPLAGATFSNAWAKWREQEKLPERSTGVVTFPFHKRAASPLNNGFDSIDTIVTKRAVFVVGRAAALIDDPDDYYGANLEPTWAAACDSLMHAAMAFGAPQWVSQQDILILATAWKAVFPDAKL
jgi:hypothetical protein